MKFKSLDVDYVRSVLDYNSETGSLTWRLRYPLSRFQRWNTRWAGKIAGRVDKKGYRRVKLLGQYYAGHRLAWLLHHGCLPESALDHRDFDKSANMIGNLRPASWSQNSAYTPVRKDNKVGIKGVCAKVGRRSVRFVAQIKKNGAVLYLGRFDTAEEAGIAYAKASREMHGEFAYS